MIHWTIIYLLSISILLILKGKKLGKSLPLMMKNPKRKIHTRKMLVKSREVLIRTKRMIIMKRVWSIYRKRKGRALRTDKPQSITLTREAIVITVN